MPIRIALFGGSFNPPGLHHLAIAEALSSRFDRVIVIPCGPRSDKSATNLLPPVYRAAMADMTFGALPKVEVNLFDLEQERFTRTHELDSRFSSEGEVWHVVGVDLIKGGATGTSEIQKSWEHGPQLWNQARFVVLTRPGYRLKKADLPPNSELIELEIRGASSDIRSRLAKGEDVADLVAARPLAYIQRYGLYRAPNPSSWARSSLTDKNFHLAADARNPKAASWGTRFEDSSKEMAKADFISVIGGDGMMLRCIREHWRARLPFYGVNAGHMGFLLNHARNVFACEFPPADVIFRQLPMLYIEIERVDGTRYSTYGFNDAWVERSTSQSAWVEVSVNGVRRLPKLVSDGVLVATAAGSTAYARSMGAAPLLADTPAWLLVGSMSWSHRLEECAALERLIGRNAESRSRPPPPPGLRGWQDQGDVISMRARISKAAAAELVFNANHDMAEKIAAIQFRTVAMEERIED